MTRSTSSRGTSSRVGVRPRSSGRACLGHHRPSVMACQRLSCITRRRVSRRQPARRRTTSPHIRRYSMTVCPRSIQVDIPKTTFESRASQSTLQISAPAQSQGPRLDDELYPIDLTDEVATGLFLGGTDVDEMLDLPAMLSFTADSHGFDAVVTLSAWVSPLGWGVPEYRYGLPDTHLTPADALAVVDAARWAHQRRGRGQRILIRSQAGLNRAGLRPQSLGFHADPDPRLDRTLRPRAPGRAARCAFRRHPTAAAAARRRTVCEPRRI